MPNIPLEFSAADISRGLADMVSHMFPEAQGITPGAPDNLVYRLRSVYLTIKADLGNGIKLVLMLTATESGSEPLIGLLLIARGKTILMDEPLNPSISTDLAGGFSYARRVYDDFVRLNRQDKPENVVEGIIEVQSIEPPDISDKEPAGDFLGTVLGHRPKPIEKQPVKASETKQQSAPYVSVEDEKILQQMYDSAVQEASTSMIRGTSSTAQTGKMRTTKPDVEITVPRSKRTELFPPGIYTVKAPLVLNNLSAPEGSPDDIILFADDVVDISRSLRGNWLSGVALNPKDLWTALEAGHLELRKSRGILKRRGE